MEGLGISLSIEMNMQIRESMSSSPHNSLFYFVHLCNERLLNIISYFQPWKLNLEPIPPQINTKNITLICFDIMGDVFSKVCPKLIS